jgi:diaminopimelate epimerase
VTELYRLSGGGNDFLALAEPARTPPPERIRIWCRRGISLGADGLFTLRRAGEPGAAPDGTPRVIMNYFNADGSAAELCANGTRCAARLAYSLGWAEDAVDVVTGAGVFRARPAGPDAVELEAPPPGRPPQGRTLEVDGERWEGWWVRVGVPVLVVPWEQSLATAPVAAVGPRLRSHPDLAPEGANVDFVRFVGPRRLELRIWERGVEAETLASGTGVLAAVLTALHLGRGRLPMEVLTAGGFTLRVAGTPVTGLPQRWALTGDARLVARETPLPGADAVPEPARWS